jgi:Flp pilus assembly protein TadG
MVERATQSAPDRRSAGTAAVEFALVLPLLMLILLGGIDWGYYFFVAQVATNAAREGARAGSLRPLDGAAAVSDAEDVARAYLTNGGLSPTKTGCTISAVAVGSDVRVSIVYPAGSITGFAAVIIPANVQTSALMRRTP